jgi:uncharacterized protein (DUF362 family)
MLISTCSLQAVSTQKVLVKCMCSSVASYGSAQFVLQCSCTCNSIASCVKVIGLSAHDALHAVAHDAASTAALSEVDCQHTQSMQEHGQLHSVKLLPA